MSAQQVIQIGSLQDITNSRMQVRAAARTAGMNLSDQARISLATSSLMEGLGLGQDESPGLITIHILSEGANNGLRVVFTFAKPRYHQTVYTATGSIGWMVDDVAIHYLDNNQVEVVLTKWAGRRQV